MFSRGGAEEAARRDQCGLAAAGAGERAQQEDRPGAEDEWGAQDQVREEDGEQSAIMWEKKDRMFEKQELVAFDNIAALQSSLQVKLCLCVCQSGQALPNISVINRSSAAY